MITNQNNESQFHEQISNLEDKIKVLNKEVTKTKEQQQQIQKENSLLEERLKKAKDFFAKQKLKIDSFEGKIDKTSSQDKINLNDMPKLALLELARQKEIKVNSRDTVQQLKDKINSHKSSLI